MRDGTEDEDDPGDFNPAHLTYGGLNDLIGLHLKLAQAAMQRSFTDLLSPLDLTQKQAAVLWLIDANPRVSQIQLATMLCMDRATMMAIIDRLDGRGLLSRERSRKDRRRQMLVLTAAGVDLLARGKALIAQHEEDLKTRIGKRGLSDFVEALKRLHE